MYPFTTDTMWLHLSKGMLRFVKCNSIRNQDNQIHHPIMISRFWHHYALTVGYRACGVVWCGVVWCGVVWCGVVTSCIR